MSRPHRQGGVVTSLVVVGKVLPALIAGRRFKFERAEIAIMATLTIGQAAATLAIAQVGVATGLFDQQILNAAVVTVVATVLITSFGTRIAARKVSRPDDDATTIGEHVIVRTGARSTAPHMARLASAVARADSGLVTPFVEALERTGRSVGGVGGQLTRLGRTRASRAASRCRRRRVVDSGAERFDLLGDRRPCERDQSTAGHGTRCDRRGGDGAMCGGLARRPSVGSNRCYHRSSW